MLEEFARVPVEVYHVYDLWMDQKIRSETHYHASTVSDAIHLHFELSYASYLVMPRSKLQSMPSAWQQRFVRCLEEFRTAWQHEDPELQYPVYNVSVLKRPQEIISFEECYECKGEGLKYLSEDQQIDCPDCEGEGSVEIDHRYETPEEVGYTTDPTPEYNRGRTKLDPMGISVVQYQKEFHS